jgi:hypothetical protein
VGDGVIVADLIELLELMPRSASVVVSIRKNLAPEGALEDLSRFRPAEPDSVAFAEGRVLLQLDE